MHLPPCTDAFSHIELAKSRQRLPGAGIAAKSSVTGFKASPRRALGYIRRLPFKLLLDSLIAG